MERNEHGFTLIQHFAFYPLGLSVFIFFFYQCHRYFKSACRVTADCHCDGKLICEDNECVVNRTNEDIRARRH